MWLILLRYWKPLAITALAAFLLVAAYGKYRVAIDAAYQRGRAETEAEVTRVRVEASAAQAAREAAYRSNNEQVRAEYAQQIADRDDRGRDLAGRLLHATAALGRERASLEASDRSRTALASAFASREEGFVRLVGQYDSACVADAAQLDALSAQVKPQL